MTHDMARRPRLTIVLAERVDDVVVITPRSPHGARGRTASEVHVAESMAEHPRLAELLAATLPALVTNPDAVCCWRASELDA